MTLDTCEQMAFVAEALRVLSANANAFAVHTFIDAVRYFVAVLAVQTVGVFPLFVARAVLGLVPGDALEKAAPLGLAIFVSQTTVAVLVAVLTLANRVGQISATILSGAAVGACDTEAVRKVVALY